MNLFDVVSLFPFEGIVEEYLFVFCLCDFFVILFVWFFCYFFVILLLYERILPLNKAYVVGDE